MTFQIDLAQLLELTDLELDPWTRANDVEACLCELADGITLEWGMKLIPQDDTGIVVECDNQWIPQGSVVKFRVTHFDESSCDWDPDSTSTFDVEGVLTIH